MLNNTNFLVDLNKSVKKILTNNIVVEKVDNFFNLIVETLDGIEIKKLGDFKYKTFESYSDNIFLDISALLYKTVLPNAKSTLDFVREKILNIKKVTAINLDNDLIQIIFVSDKIKYTFNLIVCCLISKTSEYYVIENKKWTEENVFNITNDFQQANKISSNFLFNLKRIMNFVTQNQFPYGYDIDYLILRGFYDYLSKKINKHIAQIDYEKFNIETFLKVNNLSSFLKKKLNFIELGFYILSNLYKEKSYYFDDFSNKVVEIFEGVSRYSLNTLTGFFVPVDYYSKIEIINIKNNSELQKYQKKMSMKEGYSILAFDNARQNDISLVCTPVLVSKISNIINLRTIMRNKAKELYNKIDLEKQTDIISTRSRENMEFLNNIAYKYLSSYKAKTEYLKLYFDKKYPLIRDNGFEKIIEIIKNLLNSLKEEDWYMENDY